MGSLLGDNPTDTPTDTPIDTPVDTPIDTPVDIQFPENWKEAVPEDLRNDPSMQAIKDIPGLMKSYVNAQRMIGADKIVVPNKYDDGTQLREALIKLGLPKEVDEYKINKADGLEIADEMISNFASKAHELGVLPNQAEALFNHILGEHSASTNKEIEDYNKQIIEEQEALKQEWGQGYEANIDLARKAANHLADGNQELLEHLTSPTIGGDPKMVKIFSKIGAMLKEDNIISDAKNNWGKTPEDAKREYMDIMGDPNHPYNNGKHPSHAAAVKEVSKLFQMMG